MFLTLNAGRWVGVAAAQSGHAANRSYWKQKLKARKSVCLCVCARVCMRECMCVRVCLLSAVIMRAKVPATLSLIRNAKQNAARQRGVRWSYLAILRIRHVWHLGAIIGLTCGLAACGKGGLMSVCVPVCVCACYWPFKIVLKCTVCVF